MKIDVKQVLEDSFKTSVDETVKQDLSKYILNELIPLAEDAVNNFVSQIQEQAKTEKGWVKFRDSIVLPFIINGILYVIKTTLEKTYTSIENAKQLPE
jgi:hypothetical protein